MSITQGTRIGPYTVTSSLGEGGMGIVFRAHDTKLHRDVALKLLTEHLADDADRILRFQREAQVLASLNHPNIAQIYGLEEFNNTRCIVMELVEGETLQERLKSGPIPVDEALPIAKQMAEGLEAAHERGIVHRDLKPANIKLTPHGKVKVLDFGLAKAFQEYQEPSVSNSPTLISTSIPGVILGTASYMSPEQAKGKETDRTADVWAFACVFYEMLAGHRVFEGETVGEILGGVFKAEPNWTRLPPDTPQAILRLLRRCLQKDRKLRLHDMADARLDIDEAQGEPPTTVPVAAITSRRRRERVAWAAAILGVLVGAASLSTALFNREALERPVVRFSVGESAVLANDDVGVSPDGKLVAYTALSNSKQMIWVRPLDSLAAQPVPGTEDGFQPFWSPDNRSIGFFASGKLKRVDLGASQAQVLTDATTPFGGSWNNDGVILFATVERGLQRISASGGETSTVRPRGPKEVRLEWPSFLPDGRHLLFSIVGVHSRDGGLFVGSSIGSMEVQRIIDAPSKAMYSQGHLVFVRNGVLMAQSFDLKKLLLAGEAVVSEQILNSPSTDDAQFSISSNGVLVYRPSRSTLGQLTWVDRSGNVIAKVGPVGQYANPELSRDGKRLAVEIGGEGKRDIWILELETGHFTRFTFDPALYHMPVWSPDGSRIVFGSSRSGSFDLYGKPTNLSAEEELLYKSDLDKAPYGWSADGKYLAYRELTESAANIWTLPMSGERTSIRFKPSPFTQGGGQISPDGRWIAYFSNETGRNEIVTQTFPKPGGKWQVSNAGGVFPRWRRDGKELFFQALDGKLMAVPVSYTGRAGETLIEPGTPVSLFDAHTVGGPYSPFGFRQQYDVSPDGQRFLVNSITKEVTSPVTVILNFKPKP
jgi:Tol biopolymer transport system component